MAYLRFWLRSCAVFCPALFLLLAFGAHQPLWKAAAWSVGAALIGMALMLPVIGLFSRADRNLWSPEAEEERRRRREAWRREEYESEDLR
ncbi:MAG: hypothetical protein QJR06_02570 [Alicyclobacillaceae bacterium]|nr:hypothetical protein [Alicyclobacillaceae bacterium]